jgi:hypothetical protein
VKFLFEGEKRLAGLKQAQAIDKTGKPLPCHSHFLSGISQANQTQADSMRSARSKALDGSHQQQVHHSWRGIRDPTHQIERPSPPVHL